MKKMLLQNKIQQSNILLLDSKMNQRSTLPRAEFHNVYGVSLDGIKWANIAANCNSNLSSKINKLVMLTCLSYF